MIPPFATVFSVYGVLLLLFAVYGMGHAILAVERVAQRRRRTTPALELRERLQEVLRTVPRRRVLLCEATPHASLVVEARVLAGCPSQAAYDLRGASLEPWESYQAWAKALLYLGEKEEAQDALCRARSFGADNAEFDLLSARLRAPDEEALHLALRACQRAPGYPEALYLAARLSLLLGYAQEGSELLLAIEPLMALSPDRSRYVEDLAAHRAATGRRRPGWLRRLGRAGVVLALLAGSTSYAVPEAPNASLGGVSEQGEFPLVGRLAPGETWEGVATQCQDRLVSCQEQGRDVAQKLGRCYLDASAAPSPFTCALGGALGLALFWGLVGAIGRRSAGREKTGGSA